VPDGHFLACYDYGTGGLWWFLKAQSAEDIRCAAPKLTVFDAVPEWMSAQHWGKIESDDLEQPQSEALRMILAEED
jgi:hypothetical protein